MSRLTVAVPVRDQLQFTRALVSQLQDSQPGWDRCWIYDHGSGSDTVAFCDQLAEDDPRFERVDAAGWPFYRMWNDAWQRTYLDTDGYLALLNNDIQLSAGALRTLAEVLDTRPDLWVVCPDYRPGVRGASVQEVRGSYRDHGICGWAFVLRADAHRRGVPFIDETFQWWCGDDDLFAQVEAHGGKLAIVTAARVEHVNEGTARHHPEIHAIKQADLARFAAKYRR